MNKKLLKKIIPIRIQALYKSYLTTKIFSYDIKRMTRVAINEKYEEQRQKRDLTILYHRIEKGLTMPSMKNGFGEKLVKQLINLIESFEKNNFSKEAQEYIQAVSVIKEYIYICFYSSYT